MNIKPSALNVLIIGLSSIVFCFLWRFLAGWIDNRNPKLAGAMGATL